jgi:hypothetical protein
MLCSCKLVLLFRDLAGKDKACILTICSLGMSIFNILTQLFFGPLVGQYIVFLVLPQFHGYGVHRFFSWGACAGERSVSIFFTTLHFHDNDSRYELLLTEFFNDPSRSGPFYLDGDKYAGFAITFIQYLIRRYVNTKNILSSFHSYS